MSSGVNIIEAIGRGTSISANLDSIESLPADRLSQLNTGAQAAAAATGLIAGVNPGVAISAGAFALDVAIAKAVYDYNNGAANTTLAGDAVGIIGDLAIIGGAAAGFVGATPVSEAFGALGAATDVAGIALSHPDEVVNATQNAINAISSAGSSTLNSLGNILGAAQSTLTDTINANNGSPSDASYGLSALSQSTGQNLGTIANDTGVQAVAGRDDGSGTPPQIDWTPSGGGDHTYIDGTSIQLPEITVETPNIDLSPGTSANVSGSSQTVNIVPNTNTSIGIFGQNQTITGDSGNNGINLGGDGTSATVAGGGYVGLCGNSESLTLVNSGSTVQTVNNAENESVNASGSTITLGANSLVNINGSGDTINLQGGNNDTIGATGQGLNITGDSGNDVVNLNANTTATVSGGGDVGLCGNGATLKTEADQSFTINAAPDVTNDTVYADSSTINLTPGWSGSIYGEDLTINMSPDSGSDVMVYGYGDQVNGSQGDTLQADAYDPNDTSDPYAPYEPGDPEPGTPFDPEDPDPTDPGDPDDPYDDDDELVAVSPAKSTHISGGASAAHDPTGTQPAPAATLASNAHPTTGSSSHIATQASQLASAMAAFGGTSAGDGNLHTATPTAHTTLAADPSQAAHALRHAA